MAAVTAGSDGSSGGGGGGDGISGGAAFGIVFGVMMLVVIVGVVASKRRGQVQASRAARAGGPRTQPAAQASEHASWAEGEVEAGMAVQPKGKKKKKKGEALATLDEVDDADL